MADMAGVAALAVVIFVTVFFGSAVVLVGTLTWVLHAIPGGVWSKLCRSQHPAAVLFTSLTAFVVYLGIPALIAWLFASYTVSLVAS